MSEYNKNKNGHCFKDKDLNPKTCTFSKKCEPGKVRNSEFKCVKDTSKEAYVIKINEIIVKIQDGTFRKSDATRMLNALRKEMEKDPSINISHELDSLEAIIKEKFGEKNKKEKAQEKVQETVQQKMNEKNNHIQKRIEELYKHIENGDITLNDAKKKVQEIEENTNEYKNEITRLKTFMNNVMPGIKDTTSLMKLLITRIDELYSKLDNNSINKENAMKELNSIEETATKYDINLKQKLVLLKSAVKLHFTNVSPLTSKQKEEAIAVLTRRINNIYSDIENQIIHTKKDALEQIKSIEDFANENELNINEQLTLIKEYIQTYFGNLQQKTVKNNNRDKKLKKIRDIEEKINLKTRRSTITTQINLLKKIVTPENGLNSEIERLTKLLNNTQPLKRPPKKPKASTTNTYVAVNDKNEPVEYDVQQLPNLDEMNTELSPHAFTSKKLRKIRKIKSKKSRKSKYVAVNDKNEPVEYDVQQLPNLDEMNTELSPHAFTSKKLRKIRKIKSKKSKHVKFANEVGENLQFKLPIKQTQSSLNEGESSKKRIENETEYHSTSPYTNFNREPVVNRTHTHKNVVHGSKRRRTAE
jgi:hypothetical protein